MREILMPTDFSENAMNAITYALEFFKYEKCNFYFMHTYQDEVYNRGENTSRIVFEELLENARENSQKQLDKLLIEVKKLSPNPRYQYQTISSYNALVDEADLISDAKNIDIIVMGTKGHTNTTSPTFGSNTLQVLKYVQCPVLCIPSKYKHQQPKRILFPSNFLIPFKRRELKLLCEMAHPYRAEIIMLLISNSGKLSWRQKDNRLFLEIELGKNKLTFVHRSGKEISTVIDKYITEEKIDMLVMVNTRHSFLENLLFGSTLDKLSMDLKIPMLVLQNTLRTANLTTT